MTVEEKKEYLKKHVADKKGYIGCGIRGDKLVLFVKSLDCECVKCVPEDLDGHVILEKSSIARLL